MEHIFNIVFTFECVVKVIAMGFCGERSYLHDPWNVLDFFIVAISLVTLGFKHAADSEPGTFASEMKPMRPSTATQGGAHACAHQPR